MQVESAPQVLARRRTRELSPVAFRRIAIAATGMLLLIVATGATVRLTGSGLGCQHWPGCQPGDPFPEKGYHSDVEFSNRVVAFLTVMATLVLAVAAVRTRGLSRNVRILAGVVFAGTLAQAPLGAITVYYHLDPYLVLSHLLVSLAVLGLGAIVVVEATRVVRGGGVALPTVARAGGGVLVAAVGFLVVTGTLATAAGPYPGSNGGTPVARVGSFQPAVALHVRAVAAFGIVFLFLAGWAWRNRARYPWLIRACAALLAILAVQMTIGEVQYRTQLPWWLILIHVTVAAALFGWTSALVYRLWRPLARAAA